MTNLPIELRNILSKKFILRKLTIQSQNCSQKDPTQKFNFNTTEHQTVSAVFLPHLTYQSACISTQVGCAWKCQFCASGLVPFQRNLTTGEILDQIFLIEERTNEKIQNILFMGMGEPLANYENTVQSIRWMISKNGLQKSPARITLSTTGVVPQIKKLAEEKLNIHLALSLHAPNDSIRKKIMPVSSKFHIRDVLNACKYFQTLNKSELTFEYILLKDVNDRSQDAEELVQLIESFSFIRPPKINLIPYNPVPDLPYHPPQPQQIDFFHNYLKSKNFIVHSRKPQGQDIGAACGQLS